MICEGTKPFADFKNLLNLNFNKIMIIMIMDLIQFYASFFDGRTKVKAEALSRITTRTISGERCGR